MKPTAYLLNVAFFLSFLIVMLPICFAETINPVLDANGNLVTGDGYYREYNELNQLVRIRNSTSTGTILEEFIWHPTEERILVKDVYENGLLKESIYYVDDNYVYKVNSTNATSEKYIKQDGMTVVQVVDGNKQSMHPDHLGSTSLILDSNGNTVENSWYSPFGETVGGGSQSRLDYEAKEYDEAVKDIDFHFRKYRPDWGKFTQPDTLIQNVYDPQSLNRYAFERNNPIKNSDPNGHFIPIIAIVWGIILLANVISLTIMAIDWHTNPDNRENIKHNLYLTGAATGASLIASEKIPNPYGLFLSGGIEVGMVLYSGFEAGKDLYDQSKNKKKKENVIDELELKTPIPQVSRDNLYNIDPSIKNNRPGDGSNIDSTGGKSNDAGKGVNGGQKPAFCARGSKSFYCR